VIILRIDFLGGVYHAAEPTAPTQPEWPPAPDRVFQALLDAAMALGLAPDPLRSLECAPEIAFGDALAVSGPTTYVPVAFTTRSATGTRDRLKTEKFDPVMVGITDPVFYAWPVPRDLAGWMHPVVAMITHLGRAKSLVEARLVDELPPTPHRLAPSAIGNRLLRVPTEGRLDSLTAAFLGRVRPPVALATTYLDPRSAVAPSPWGELISLQTTEALSLLEAGHLAEATRAAVLAHAGDAAPLVLHGHSPVPHVAWAAFPDIGHDQTCGRLLGLGAWLPANIADEDRTACVIPVLRLTHVMLGTRRIAVERVCETDLPYALTRPAWCRASEAWGSVTPVVLDRHPKRGQTSQSVVADCVERAGYPRPTAVEIGQFSAHRGVPVARAFRPLRGGRWLHALLTFSAPVAGPVLVGKERYFGMGLFAPIPAPPTGAIYRSS
jgi:CRISPR-associated protein Csb2